MYGAIIGDIVGSKYEFNNIKTKDFPFISAGCDYTDDSIMTIAVAQAIMRSRKNMFEHSDRRKGFREFLIDAMQEFGRKYPYPLGSYGIRFSQWLRSPDPRPYNSYGNGSAMRVSPCGLAAVTLEEALALADISARVTHDHPEGIKGAKAVAAAIFLAKANMEKDAIRKYIEDNYYDLSFTLDEIRPTYRFDESCQKTVPQAIVAFLESTDFEDAIRNAISIGGDSDTIAAITGSIAWSFYRFNIHCQGPMSGKKTGRIWPDACDRIITETHIDSILPPEFVDIIEQFDILRMQRAGTFDRVGSCTPILSSGEFERYKRRNTHYFRLTSGLVLKIMPEKLTAYRFDREKEEWQEDGVLFTEYEYGNLWGRRIDFEDTYPTGTPFQYKRTDD